MNNYKIVYSKRKMRWCIKQQVGLFFWKRVSKWFIRQDTAEQARVTLKLVDELKEITKV